MLDLNRRDLLRIFLPGGLVLGMFTFIMTRQACVQHDFAAPARLQAEARCNLLDAPQACLGLIDRFHDTCAKRSLRKPKHADYSFDDAEYARCVELGPDAARKLKKAERDAARD